MPKCHDCGKETPRENMFGVDPDLRCSACAQRRRSRLTPRREFFANAPPIWSYGLILLAATTYAAERHPEVERAIMLWMIPDRIWDGEIWRLVTTILPHGGLLHLFFNCVAIGMLGPAVEGRYGSARFLGLIIVLALAANSFSFLINPVAALGLSGVAYGLFGFLWALRRHKDFAAEVIQPAVVKSFMGWFVLCFILTYAGGLRVANWAHAGGLISGWLLGKCVLLRRPVFGVALVVAVTMMLVMLTTYMPWNRNYNNYQNFKNSSRNLSLIGGMEKMLT